MNRRPQVISLFLLFSLLLLFGYHQYHQNSETRLSLEIKYIFNQTHKDYFEHKKKTVN